MKKKILFVVRQLGMGGIERIMIELSNEAKNDFQIGIYSITNFNEFSCFTSLDESLLLKPKLFHNYKKLIPLMEVISMFKPDIIHCFDLTSGIYAKIADKLLLGRRKIISAFGAASISDKRLKYFLSKNYLQPDIYICNSKVGASSLEKIAPKGVEITVIVNGLQEYSSTHESLDQFGTTKDCEFVIGYIGKLDELKHGERVVDIAIALDNICSIKPYFIIFGKGPNLDPTLARLKKLPDSLTDRIKIVGEIPDAIRFINNFTIGILTSDTEGLPTVLIEYMMQGVPWISTNVGDVKLLNANGSSGIVIENWDGKKFAEALCMLLNDKNKLEHYGTTGKDIFKRYYSMNKIYKSYLEIYNKLIFN